MSKRKPEGAECTPRRKAKGRTTYDASYFANLTRESRKVPTKMEVFESKWTQQGPYRERPIQRVTFQPAPRLKPGERRAYHLEIVAIEDGSILAPVIVEEHAPWWLRAWRWATRWYDAMNDEHPKAERIERPYGEGYIARALRGLEDEETRVAMERARLEQPPTETIGVYVDRVTAEECRRTMDADLARAREINERLAADTEGRARAVAMIEAACRIVMAERAACPWWKRAIAWCARKLRGAR